MIFPDYYELELKFHEHRNKAFLTCDETCFCWEVEQWLLPPEISTKVEADDST